MHDVKLVSRRVHDLLLFYLIFYCFFVYFYSIPLIHCCFYYTYLHIRSHQTFSDLAVKKAEPLLLPAVLPYGSAFIYSPAAGNSCNNISVLTLQICLHIPAYFFYNTGSGFGCRPGHMRCNQQPVAVLYPSQQIVRGNRLLLQYIQSCPGYLFILKRPIQIRIVNHRTPGYIQQYSSPFHFFQRFFVNQPSRPLTERTMKRQNIGRCKQRIQIHPLIVRAGTLTGCGIKDHTASKRLRSGSDFSANVSHPHDAPCFSGQLSKRQIKIGKPILCAVCTALDILIIMSEMLQKIEQHGKGMLTDRIRTVIHHIGHFDPSAPAVLQIHTVIAGGKQTNQLYRSRIF